MKRILSFLISVDRLVHILRLGAIYLSIVSTLRFGPMIPETWQGIVDRPLQNLNFRSRLKLQEKAVDILKTDTTFWGNFREILIVGLENLKNYEEICKTFLRTPYSFMKRVGGKKLRKVIRLKVTSGRLCGKCEDIFKYFGSMKRNFGVIFNISKKFWEILPYYFYFNGRNMNIGQD